MSLAARLGTTLFALGLVACRSDPAPVETGPTLATAAAPRFVAGDTLLYDFEWTVGTTAELGHVLPEELPVEGGVKFAGLARVRVHGPVQGGTLLSVAWTRLDAHAITMMGVDVVPGTDGLLDREAWIVVDDVLGIRDIYFEPDASPLLRRMMTGMLAQTDLRVLRPGEGPRASQIATGSGLAEVEYAWAQPQRLVRTLRGIARLDAYAGEGAPHGEGTATIVVDEAGAPKRLEAEEIVWVAAGGDDRAFESRTSFSLVRRAIERQGVVVAPDLAAMIRVDPSAPPDDTEGERLLAQRFSEGLTMLDVEQAVRSASLGGLRPRPGFLVQATGFLRGWPEHATELEPMLRDEPDPRARALVVDLLASAGTPEAQRVLCEVLGEPQMRAHADHASLLQRFSFLWRPLPETARFLVDEHDRAREAGESRGRLATLPPIGAVAGRILAIDPFTSAALRKILVDELAAATDVETRVAALAGLGNAGVVDELPDVLALAHDPDFEVRAAAASALRQTKDARAVAAVFALLSDEDPLVAREAVVVLDAHLLDEVGSIALAAHVLTGAFNPDAAGKLVAALGRRRDDDPWVRAALVALAVRTSDPQERDRIATMLAMPSEPSSVALGSSTR